MGINLARRLGKARAHRAFETRRVCRRLEEIRAAVGLGYSSQARNLAVAHARSSADRFRFAPHDANHRGRCRLEPRRQACGCGEPSPSSAGAAVEVTEIEASHKFLTCCS